MSTSIPVWLCQFQYGNLDSSDIDYNRVRLCQFQYGRVNFYMEMSILVTQMAMSISIWECRFFNSNVAPSDIDDNVLSCLAMLITGNEVRLLLMHTC